jgi:hypothetical protein
MGHTRRWTPGSRIVYREVWRGGVWTAKPVIVVQDEPELIVLFLQAGTIYKVPAGRQEQYQEYQLRDEWQLADAVWDWGDNLILIHPGAAHAVKTMWGKTDRELVGWYVNLQEPLRRTVIGFDYMDQDLDIVVSPDLSGWQWKDEALFRRRRELGLISEQEAGRIRAEGERVIERIRARASPFGDGWEDWIPPPGWAVPELPAGWDRID